MEALFEYIIFNVEVFFLSLVRISGMLILAPVFSRSEIPVLLRVWLGVLISFVMLPGNILNQVTEIDGFFVLALYAINEFFIGLTLGFIAFTFISVMYLAGRMIDTQMGFGMVNVFDPQTNLQIPVMGNFYNMFLILLFLVMNGHHMLIKALEFSFERIPIGLMISFDGIFIERFVEIYVQFFVLAFQFSAPVIATIFLANVLLGVLARTMPQMNVFIVGLPLKVGIGLLTVIVSLQFFVPFSENLFDLMFDSLKDIIEILSRG